MLKELTVIEKEVNFLNACGVSTKNGYTSDDVFYWKNKQPELFLYYVVNW